MRRTSRGFAIYGEVKDQRGTVVRLQRSSAVGAGNANGFHHGPWCWLTVVGPSGDIASQSPHLTRGQARRVAKALLRFADGEE